MNDDNKRIKAVITIFSYCVFIAVFVLIMTAVAVAILLLLRLI